MKGRLLIVDDDAAHLSMLETLLKSLSYAIECVKDGADAIRQVQKTPYDLVLMDVRMANVGGMEALKEIKHLNPAIPVIIMTAYSSVDKAVEAMRLGADDYLTKPFAAKELVARVKAVLRRSQQPDEKASTVICGELEIDFARRTVKVKGEQVSLTRTEYALLRQLASHLNCVVLHQDLLTTVWGPEYRDDVDYLRAYVRYLRRKLEVDPSDPQYIMTAPGIGYMLTCPQENKQ